MKLRIFLLLCFVLLLITITYGQSSRDTNPKRDFDCGVLSRELLLDKRIFTSFVAGIFIKQQDFKEPFRFYLSGTIIGPTSVLTIWGGAYGASLRDKSQKYVIPRPEQYFIAAGLNSTDVFSADQYLQIRNVEYIVPHADENPNNHGFHLVIFHTKTPFDFTSNLIKPICLPTEIISPEQISHFIAGFEFSPKKIKYSRTQLFYLETPDVCRKSFWYYYKANSSHILCAKPLPDFHEDYCVTHGSGLTFLIQGKYYLGGVVALIPSKRGNICTDNSVYFFSSFTSAEESEQITWMNRNIDCSPNGFPCKRGPCIPLSKVCDHIVDCPDGDDESRIFCDAATYCENEKYIACGLKDNCIHPGQVCDKKSDCQNHVDESSFFCGVKSNASTSDLVQVSRYRDYVSNRVVKGSRGKCEEIQVSYGVKVECTDEKNATISCEDSRVGSKLKMSCKPYYISKFRHSMVTMTCDEDGKWKPFRSFGCDAECGRVDFLSSSGVPFISNGQEAASEHFPWYVAVFYLSAISNTFEFICGGTLIEQQVIVTAAHCFHKEGSSEVELNKYRVVLGAASSNFDENEGFRSVGTIIVGINGIWVPPTFDSFTLKSDLALVRLSKPVEYNKHVRPACYLTRNEFPLPPPGSLGVLAGFGKDELGVIPSTLKWAHFPVVNSSVCQESLDLSVATSEFCAGFQNGTAACEGDSGGGIVFRKRSRDPSSPLVLKGVVSRGVLTKDSMCHTHNLAVFTLVDFFSDWMFDILETMETAL